MQQHWLSTKTNVNGRRYFCVTVPKLGGGRKRRFFKERAHADTFMQLTKVQQANFGLAALSIPDALRVEAIECTNKLEPFGATLRDAVEFYLPHLAATKRSCTASALIDELIQAKEGRRCKHAVPWRSARAARNILRAYSALVLSRRSPRRRLMSRSSLCEKQSGKRLSAVTRNHFRRLLVVAFNFARSRGYCVANPAEQSAKAKEIHSPVGILSAMQTARLLEKSVPELLPYRYRCVRRPASRGTRTARLERSRSAIRTN